MLKVYREADMTISDSHPSSKLNQLLQKWPKGAVATYPWLKEQGISRQLVGVYKRYHWLTPVGRGAFVRSGESVTWPGALHAIQREHGCTIHAAGKTALQLQGYAHFLPAGESAPIWVQGAPGERLPLWFTRHKWQGRVHYSTSRLLPPPLAVSLGLSDHDHGGLSIRLSTPERAILEVLPFVPDPQSFEEARLLMEGLRTLRPKLVQELLEACTSVKAKRLFLVLAEACAHAWLKNLDLSRISLGAGKRVLVAGGRLHPKYQITVPPDVLPATVSAETSAP